MDLITGQTSNLSRVQYLSDSWIEAANAAVAAGAASAPTERVVIDQHIADTVGYRVVIEREACSIVSLDSAHVAEPADASFHQSLETAQAVATGATDAHQAFLLGQIRFEGNIDIVIERRDAFGWLETALAPVMAETTFA